MPSRRRAAHAWYSPVICWQTDDTVDLEIAAWSPSASARVASTSRTDRPPDEGRNDQGFEGIGLGHVAAEQAGRERLGGAAQLRPGQGNRPGGRLDGHLPVAVTRTRPAVFGQRGAGVTVPPQEL